MGVAGAEGFGEGKDSTCFFGTMYKVGVEGFDGPRYKF